MFTNKTRNIIDFRVQDNPAIILGLVLADLVVRNQGLWYGKIHSGYGHIPRDVGDCRVAAECLAAGDSLKAIIWSGSEPSNCRQALGSSSRSISTIKFAVIL